MQIGNAAREYVLPRGLIDPCVIFGTVRSGGFARVDIGPQFVSRDLRQALDLKNALDRQPPRGLPFANRLVTDLAESGERRDATSRIDRFLDGIHGAQSTTYSCDPSTTNTRNYPFYDATHGCIR